MKKYYKIGSIALALTLLVLYVLDMAKIARRAGKANAEAMNYALPSDKILTREDSLIFRSASWERLSPIVVWRHAIREPIVFLNYNAESAIVVNKIKVDESFTMSESFRWVDSTIEFSNSEFVSYRSTDEGNYFTLHAFGNLNPRPGKIFLTLDSDSLRNTTSNDSVLAFNLRCKRLTVMYDSIPVDILLEKPNSWLNNKSGLPLNLYFRKKQEWVYLFFMISADLDKRMKDGTLDSLINTDF